MLRNQRLRKRKQPDSIVKDVLKKRLVLRYPAALSHLTWLSAGFLLRSIPVAGAKFFFGGFAAQRVCVTQESDLGKPRQSVLADPESKASVINELERLLTRTEAKNDRPR